MKACAIALSLVKAKREAIDVIVVINFSSSYAYLYILREIRKKPDRAWEYPFHGNYSVEFHFRREE